jgi:hypothetical protein
MESQTMDICMYSYGVQKQKDYKMSFFGLSSPKQAVSYEALPLLSHDVVLQSIWTITSHLCLYLRNSESVILVLLELLDHTQNSQLE